ncbi:phage tail protein [Pseudomonas sp. NPDC098740]|uniref:phage tail protein n=1 Tax=Pseudomonas sp. NPDC098740 TaxID=3364486 RepID=UPI00383B1F82
MFTSKSTRGFYDTEIHGVRLTTIQDSAWVRPKTDIVVEPGESVWVGDELMTNTGDEPITLRDVPDMSAIPDTLEVANPVCLIPQDAVEITSANHAELLAGQSEGKVIAWGDDGYPVLIDPPLPSPEFFAEVERAWRDGQLAATDGIVSRHRDELEEGLETTLTPAQYIELQAYRRALRNWPEAGEFPLIEHRPTAPPWLTELFH